MSRGVDFNQVRYFLALADTLNFTRAAERCYVSQPALTQSIKRLEEELGGPLIRRAGRDSELTELGKALRGQFEQIDRTRHSVRNTARAVVEGEIAELDIGIMCTVGPRVVAAMLRNFQRSHPSVSLVLHDITPKAIPGLLLSGVLDGVFCARSGPPDARLRHIDLFEEDMVVAFPRGHPFSEAEHVPLRALAEQPYIERLHCEFREPVARIYTEEDLTLDVAFSSEREDWVQSVVRDGSGVSVIPRFSLLMSDLDYRPIVEPELRRTVGFAIADRDEPATALTLFVEDVRLYDWAAAIGAALRS